jgi:hypothetical protein
MNIEELPDFPALRQLATAFWRDGNGRGAAVLVGAGFSRNAKTAGEDTPKPPLWSNLRLAMIAKLYPGNQEAVTADPLRLAQEFKCYYGPAALDEFLREQIPDVAWSPGKQHLELMKLPWSDVLTTNWDTLLERASPGHYRVVRNQADIARVRAPRVVKLHGSIDTSAPLVFTEDDYRTYPARSAAFVNLARQVFLENELCLVGFSGDDPNFLQWTGWVRDHLGEDTRRIYLVGALKLSAAARKLLESRNVAPIDFTPMMPELGPDEAGGMAMDLFLNHLAQSKPKRKHDWKPKSTHDYGFQTIAPHGNPALSDEEKSVMLDKAEKIWKADRESYPSWLICPARQRYALRHGSLYIPFPLPWAILEAKPREQRATFLYELAWRLSTALWPLDEELAGRLWDIADPQRPCGLGRDRQLEIAGLLLREARLSRDKVGFLHAEAVLDQGAVPGSDAHGELVYQQLLWARDELNYQAVSAGLKKLEGDDPVWKLRRAALHWECGEPEEAKSLLQAAMADLDDRQKRDPSSIWVASRRSWAAIVARAVRRSDLGRFERDDGPNEFAEIGCDPDDEIETLQDEAEERLRKLSEKLHDFEPSFGPGSYKNNKSTITFTSGDWTTAAATVARLTEIAGVPIRMPHVDVAGSLSVEAAEAWFEPTLAWHLRQLRSIYSHSDSVVLRRFGRIAVARLDPLVAKDLTSHIFAAVRFWLDRVRKKSEGGLFPFERLRVFVEVLSRLVPRADEATILSAFELAVELAHDAGLNHNFLYESFADLAEHSFNSLSRAKRGSLALECLRFPLPNDKPWSAFGPNPAADLFSHWIAPQRPPGDSRWRVQVNVLIEGVAANGASRGQAVQRLTYLCHNGALEEDEKNRFGLALWSKTDPKRHGLPSDIDIFPHVIIGLPAPDGIDPMQIARGLLYGAPLRGSDLRARLPGMIAASLCQSPFTKVLATRGDAVRILDEIISLNRETRSVGPLETRIWEQIEDDFGDVIARVILPQLDAADLTEGRVQFIFAMSEAERGRAVLAGLPWLVVVRPDLLDRAAIRLRRAISRGNLFDLQVAARAVETWASHASKGSEHALPENVISTLVTAIEAGRLIGLQSLLWCIRRLFEDGFLSAEHTSSVGTTLGDLLNDLSYEAMPEDGPEAIGLTTARAECVRLSHALIKAGQGNEAARSWMELSASDPLPEVRSAIESM